MPRDSAVARDGIYVGTAWQQVQILRATLRCLGNPLWRFERETQTALPCLIAKVYYCLYMIKMVRYGLVVFKVHQTINV